jgi:hypothetical protein
MCLRGVYVRGYIDLWLVVWVRACTTVGRRLHSHAYVVYPRGMPCFHVVEWWGEGGGSGGGGGTLTLGGSGNTGSVTATEARALVIAATSQVRDGR